MHETLAFTLVTTLTHMVHAIIDVGFVVVAFSVVRPRGLAGGGLIAGGAVVRCAQSVFFLVQWPIIKYAMAKMIPPEHFHELVVVWPSFLSIVGGVGSVMIIAGVVALARSAVPRVLTAAPGTQPGP